MANVQLRQVVKSYDGKNTVIHGIDLDYPDPAQMHLFDASTGVALR